MEVMKITKDMLCNGFEKYKTLKDFYVYEFIPAYGENDNIYNINNTLGGDVFANNIDLIFDSIEEPITEEEFFNFFEDLGYEIKLFTHDNYKLWSIY